ncbi:MAG: radical SAM protein [Verrucomicrobia bacterium]|jgi:radical SAM protein with 4Fe4S-binding SPASM domain|nr:radical SAM protein [Alphaproteobacteria bacterium]MBT7027314.1 radical SAM protein [Verrucomicrobiota bacterium]MBT7942269.1 radical SAM protein [Alphaproteobacteria bacterium]
MVEFFDPAIDRKSNIVDRSFIDQAGPGTVPLPSVVEVSESGTCNRKCSFCPRSAPNFEDVKKFIPTALIAKLSRQLNEVGYKGIFLFSGFVEPLLDKNIFNLVSTVSQECPGCRPEMVTNGDVLNRDRLKRLFDSGLKTLLISVYDSEDDALRFEELCRSIGLSDDQYVIRRRFLPEEQDFGITLSNRAGMMNKTEHIIPALAQPLEKPCYYPHYTFFMDYVGDVLLCPHDWGKKKVVGNLNDQDFMDIWTDPEITLVRKRLQAADRGFAPCNVCDAQGVMMGKKHVDAWNVLYENDSD